MDGSAIFHEWQKARERMDEQSPWSKSRVVRRRDLDKWPDPVEPVDHCNERQQEALRRGWAHK